MIEYFIFYVTVSINQLVQIFCFNKLTKPKEKKLKFAGLIILTSLIMTIFKYYSLNVIISVCTIFTLFLLYWLIFSFDVKKTAYYGIAIWLVGIILDIGISLFVSNFYFIFVNANIFYTRIGATIILWTLLILIFCSKKFQNIINIGFKKLNKSDFLILKVTYIMIVLLSLGYVILNNIYNENFKRAFTFFSISVIFLILLYIKKEYNYAALKETNNLLIKNTEFYLKISNDYHILKHNIVHQLNSIKSVSNQKSKALIEDLLKEYNRNSGISHIIKTMPAGINGIVYEHIYSYNDLNIGVDNEITTDMFENLTPRSYNLLCESLGILLDNALEAASKSEEKSIMIDMFEVENTYHIKIINTFTACLDIDKLGTIHYTTKNNGHGIGLFSIIFKKRINVKTSIINNLFHNEIIIDKKKL